MTRDRTIPFHRYRGDAVAWAIPIILKHEGGYVCDPEDPDVDIENLKAAQAKGIYRREWWDRYGYGRIEDQAVAAKVLSLAANMGPLDAHRLLQQALCDAGAEVAVDGVIGPETLAAVNSDEVYNKVL